MSVLANNIQESSQDIINDIQSLQTTEQGLFNSLETNPNLTSQQQQDIIDKINQVTNMRISLYQTLSNVNGYFQDALKTSHGTLEDQSMAVQIVEDELNHMKQNLQLLQTEKNNKVRLVEINSYYGDKYAEHSNLMKIIIFTLVPVIIISLVYRSGIIPTNVYYILLSIVVIIGSYYFWLRFVSIITRDTMDYNEYDWNFNPDSAPKSNSSGSSKDPWLSADLGTCVAAECCSKGQTYDESLSKCIDNTTKPSPSSNTQERYVNNELTKTNTTNKYKHANHASLPPIPSKTESFITYSTFR
jgi:hypothetical protein